MPFDDIEFYRNLSIRRGMPVLELGCGNGRILLNLRRAGIDAMGIDFSEQMLAQLRGKAISAGIEAPICQMDARSLAFQPVFQTVLCPYSLITYMTGSGDLSRLLNQAGEVMKEGGSLIVDAFVPRAGIESGDFRPDYRRPYHGGSTLIRSKRLSPISPEVNRIERRYEILSPHGELLEKIDTVEEVRPFQPVELAELLLQHQFVVEETWWDYHTQEPVEAAQFVTLVATRAG